MARWAHVPDRYEEAGGALGGFGEVRRYIDRRSGEPVAIKRMGDITLPKSKKVLREVRIQVFFSATHSPHIVPILDYFVARNPQPAAYRLDTGLTAFTVMPRALCSLDVLLAHWAAPHLPTPTGWPPALSDAVARRDPRLPPVLMAHILLGLHVFHSAGVMHRDLRPENVLVFAAPRPPAGGEELTPWQRALARVCGDPAGFGVVAAVADPGWARSITYAVAPTPEHVAVPAFRAPELVVDGRRYGQAVDMWAVGAIAAEWFRPMRPAATDRPPNANLFPLLAPVNAHEVLYGILLKAPIPSFRDLLSWLARFPSTAADTEHLARRRDVLGMFWVAQEAANGTLLDDQLSAAVEAIARMRALLPAPAAGHGVKLTADAADYCAAVAQYMYSETAKRQFSLKRDHEGHLRAPTWDGDDVTEATSAPLPPFTPPADLTRMPEAPMLAAELGVVGGASEEALVFVAHCLRIPQQQRPSAFQALSFPWIARAINFDGDAPLPPPGEAGGGAGRPDPAGVVEARFAAGSLAREDGSALTYNDGYDRIATTVQMWDAADYDEAEFATETTAAFAALLTALADAFAAWLPTRQPVTTLSRELFGVLPFPPKVPPALVPVARPAEAELDEAAAAEVTLPYPDLSPDADPTRLVWSPAARGGMGGGAAGV